MTTKTEPSTGRGVVMTAILCTAPVCLEDAREIPEIGTTGMRKGKQTFLNGVNLNLGWTHLDCEPDSGSSQEVDNDSSLGQSGD